ncbi:hypothetical protein F5878DRAFT_652273 [Lentinula raphanica]|uniref:Protein YAE1 n=1 Tax=Lentinula raphanica TaxID=153919 RepID=A0AA38P8L9_9AGAR|nr:hypothetical protein F5878DRAFT_652273 [Lentinula raphanica]
MDSPWDEEAGPHAIRDSEWSRISNEFTTAGYREGITAGKEAALQEGFDAGFATVGVPIGREIGILRGVISALLSYVSLHGENLPGGESTLIEVRSIASQLSNIRFADIAPRDLEAEEHAREHLEMVDEDAETENEELVQKRAMEGLEDMLASLGSGPDPHFPAQQRKPTMEDVGTLKERTLSLCALMKLDVHWS